MLGQSLVVTEQADPLAVFGQAPGLLDGEPGLAAAGTADKPGQVDGTGGIEQDPLPLRELVLLGLELLGVAGGGGGRIEVTGKVGLIRSRYLAASALPPWTSSSMAWRISAHSYSSLPIDDAKGPITNPDIVPTSLL